MMSTHVHVALHADCLADVCAVFFCLRSQGGALVHQGQEAIRHGDLAHLAAMSQGLGLGVKHKLREASSSESSRDHTPSPKPPKQYTQKPLWPQKRGCCSHGAKPKPISLLYSVWKQWQLPTCSIKFHNSQYFMTQYASYDAICLMLCLYALELLVSQAWLHAC